MREYSFISEQYRMDYDLAFANGGDQDNDTIPEIPVCKELGVALIDGLGDKIQSSSWLLKVNNLLNEIKSKLHFYQSFKL